MFRCLFLFITLLFLAGSPVSAQPLQSDQDFVKWMTYYYKDKNSSQVAGFLKWMQDSQILEKSPQAVKTMSAFLSVIFADNPDKVPTFLKTDTFTGNAKKAIEIGLWLANDEKNLSTFATDKSLYRKTPPKLAEAEIVSPDMLDMMWAAFMASGDSLYVKKVIDALGSQDVLIQGAAKWSLSSNMKQHELVDQIVKSEALTRDGVIKKEISELMAENSPKKFP